MGAIPDRAARRRVQKARAHNGPGDRVLILAIIAQAVIDLADGHRAGDAAAYLLGPVYRNHVTWLGLPADYLPEGLDAAALRSLAGARWAGRRMSQNDTYCHGVENGKTNLSGGNV